MLRILRAVLRKRKSVTQPVGEGGGEVMCADECETIFLSLLFFSPAVRSSKRLAMRWQHDSPDVLPTPFLVAPKNNFFFFFFFFFFLAPLSSRSRHPAYRVSPKDHRLPSSNFVCRSFQTKIHTRVLKKKSARSVVIATRFPRPGAWLFLVLPRVSRVA